MLYRTRLISLHMMLPVTAVILLLSGVVVDAAWPPMMAKPGCQDKCGNVTIPYPFGIGPNCYYTEWYSITCDNFTPTLSKFGLQVFQIALGSTEVRVDIPFSFNCSSGNSTWTSTDFSGSPYTFSTENFFAPVHCPATALSNGGDRVVAQCGSVCDSADSYAEPVCLTYPPYPLNVYSVNFTRNSSACSYVFLIDGNYLDNLNLSQPQSVWSIGQDGTRIPVVLNWVYEYLPGLSSDNANPNCVIYEDGIYDYKCACPPGKGLGGNPYLLNGCQHIPECGGCKGECYVDGDDYTRVMCFPSTKSRARFLGIVIGVTVGIGSLFLALGGCCLRCFLKRRKEIKQRAQTFNHNGGLLLQQQVSSTDGVGEVATIHLNQKIIVGQGGQGNDLQ
ncbi:wall-associated receptor kinase-like 6 [Silene latifolia]|uniref:wall-associated receptor kinase-like 6 n=1 Tax=Silene latifolia TaxID=37657 RepID=UPI003D785B2B